MTSPSQSIYFPFLRVQNYQGSGLHLGFRFLSTYKHLSFVLYPQSLSAFTNTKNSLRDNWTFFFGGVVLYLSGLCVALGKTDQSLFPETWCISVLAPIVCPDSFYCFVHLSLLESVLEAGWGGSHEQGEVLSQIVSYCTSILPSSLPQYPHLLR